MLNKLLELSEDERNNVIAEMAIPDRKVLFDSIPTLTELLNLDDVADYEERVKLRYEYIQQHPDERFWEYAECFNPASAKRKVAVPDYEVSRYCKVSTNGEVIVLNAINRMFIRTSKVTDRYRGVRIDNNPKTIHRIVASTFIPRPEGLKNIAHKYLEVNHIDTARYNNCVLNLEWVTNKANVRHRYGIERYNEDKYFKFEVAVDNGFLGRKFVLHEDELCSINTNVTHLRKVIASGADKTYKGCKVNMIHHEEIGDCHIGYPEDIAELYAKSPSYFDATLSPIIATVIEGQHKGLTFSFFGSKDINQYFNRVRVEAAAGGKIKSHAGCTFRRATHKEAISLHGKVTKETADKLLRNYSYKLFDREGKEQFFLFTVAVDNGFKGRQFVLSEHDLGLIGTTFGLIRRYVDSEKYSTYRGLTVKQITQEGIGDTFVGYPKDIAELYNRDTRYFDVTIKPIVSTALHGDHLGQQFSLFGAQEVDCYFNHRRVISVLRGERNSHYGFTFRYGTVEEAIPLHNKLTKEIVDNTFLSFLHKRNKKTV